MVFEILRDNFSLLQTDQINYPKDILLDMAKYGHKFKIDGKAVSVQKVIELIKDDSNDTADEKTKPKQTKKKTSAKK